MSCSNSRPDLSIVLVTKNRAKLFERSLLSILHEVETNCPNSEIIIVDGGSTDGTVDIIKKYSHRLGYWVSEADSGVAEAVNKGVALARGDIVRLIGDDDEMIPGRLSVMMDAVGRLPEYGVIAGHNEAFVEEESGCQHFPQPRFCGELTRENLYNWGMKHGILVPEACFFRKDAFNKVGGYDLSLRWWGFLDLFLKMIHANIRFFVVPVQILKTYQHPLSETRSNLYNKSFWDEHHRVIKRHRPFFVMFHWSMWRFESPESYLNKAAARVGKATGLHPRRLVRQILNKK